MKLKKIIVYGFKSFADKTEFEFGDGITVIVGPNGCGKSNVVDAVRWVLGEQSAKSLRGGQMLDVIFNGTSSRKSTGMAEVTLLFENNQRLIDCDLDEISVTRRLYRSGESEYLLNNKTSRLKDIRELFMGTGVGADAYSIIEQGKVDVLLQSSKDDRRAIFEEAAGISRYKARKKEAMRKLQRTEQNVLRIQDILGELEKRLRSVKLQAGKARNYQGYLERLNELRLNQFLAELYQLQNDAKQLEKDIVSHQDELVGVTAAGEQTQTRLSVLDHELEKCDQEIMQVENQLLQCTSQISTQQDRIDMSHRRCNELQEFVDKSMRQLQTQREQGKQLKQQLQADQEQIDTFREDIEARQQHLQALQQEHQQYALHMNELRAQLEDEKSGLIDIVRRTAHLHNEISSLDLTRDNLSGQKNRLNDRYGKISQEIEGYLSRRGPLAARQNEIEQLIEDSQEQLNQKREQLSLVSEQKLICSENLSAAKEHRSGLVSRRQLLQDMENKLEGVDKAVREILTARQDNPEQYYYVRGMVAELIQADVTYAAIVDAALNERAQHLVASDSQVILENMERLSELPGRVHLICMDRLGPLRNGFDYAAFLEVKGRLVDLVRYEEDIAPLVWHLLGRTLLVDDVPAALKLADAAPAGYRFVTMQGELLEADGTLHLGPPTGQVGLISRKSELRDLENSINDSDERIRQLQNESEQYDNQARHLEKNLQELRTAIYEANTEKISVRSQLEQIDENISRLKQEQPLIVSDVDNIEKQVMEALERQETSRKTLGDLEDINQQRQTQIDSLERQIAEQEMQEQQIAEKITDVRVELGQTQQQRLALQERIGNVQRQIQQNQHTLKSLETDLENARANFQDTERAILAAESFITELFMKRQEHQQNSSGLNNRRRELHEEKDSLTEKARVQNRQREQLQEVLHGMQMKASENNLRRENLIQRGHEELKVDLEERFGSYEFQDMDWQAVSDEIEDLRTRISRLGNVNLDAITEQDELEERLSGLNEQYNDLAEARKQLEQLIEKINQESTEIFLKNFEMIRANFSDLFRKLFGGGRAEVILEDTDNVLECGIEIVARPPGKQPQSISLLSGGEKTMTAVALLMAIFKSKPSPFCLMDEVDAALDEANVERFTLVVQEFLAESQFIIITHSRRTMSVADVIYGVTMQEQGVSKKVSVRFSGEDDDLEDSAVA